MNHRNRTPLHRRRNAQPQTSPTTKSYPVAEVTEDEAEMVEAETAAEEEEDSMTEIERTEKTTPIPTETELIINSKETLKI